MKDETLDSLTQYREEILRTIEGEKRKLAGVEQRIREKVREVIEELKAAGIKTDDLSAEFNTIAPVEAPPLVVEKVKRATRPKGFWPFAIASYLRDTKTVYFTLNEFVEYLALNGIQNLDRQVAYQGIFSSPILTKNDAGQWSLKVGVTRDQLDEMVLKGMEAGIEFSTPRHANGSAAEHAAI